MTDADRILAVDLDGVLCEQLDPSDPNYGSPRPQWAAIRALDELMWDGWQIVIHSGRHVLWYEKTIEWLRQYEVPFHHLVLGKPPARYYLDDRAIHVPRDADSEWWKRTSMEIGKP